MESGEKVNLTHMVVARCWIDAEHEIKVQLDNAPAQTFAMATEMGYNGTVRSLAARGEGGPAEE